MKMFTAECQLLTLPFACESKGRRNTLPSATSAHLRFAFRSEPLLPFLDYIQPRECLTCSLSYPNESQVESGICENAISLLIVMSRSQDPDGASTTFMARTREPNRHDRQPYTHKKSSGHTVKKHGNECKTMLQERMVLR